MHIKILGPGCGNCHTLEHCTREALTELGLTAEITAVTDYPTIAGYGVMNTPALVIDDHVVLTGRVPTIARIRELLTSG